MQAFHAPLTTSSGRRLALATALLAASPWCALAQTYSTTPTQEPVKTLEQKTEHLTHEDAGSRIEELRVGGQTRSIEVETKTGVPGYQVKPLDPARPAEGTGPGAQPEGKSSWRLLNF
ncbi:MAG TPA: hypothetical protein VFY31_09050 [Macromonas sp.]|nr:hypothetical protein [Macromonas sp.]